MSDSGALENPELKARIEQGVWRQAYDEGYASWSHATERGKDTLLLVGPALAWAESWMMTHADDIPIGQKRYIVRSLAARSRETAAGRAAFDSEELRKESRLHWLIIAASAFTVYLMASGLMKGAGDHRAPGQPRQLEAKADAPAAPKAPAPSASPLQQSIERAINGPANPEMARRIAEAAARNEVVTTGGPPGPEGAVPVAAVASPPPGAAWQAARRKDVVEKAERERAREVLRRLTELSLARADQGDRRTSVLLAVEALQQVLGQPAATDNAPAIADATQILFRALATATSLLAPGNRWSEGVQPILCDGGRRIIGSVNGDRIAAWDAASPGRATEAAKSVDRPAPIGVDRDCRRIAVAGEDFIAEVATLTDPRPPMRLAGHEADLMAVRFSPDGRRIVTASQDMTARIWSAETGRPIAVLRGHDAGVNGAEWSADGRHLVTWSTDKTARLWSADGRADGILAGHQSAITDAHFSGDGTRVLTISLDGTAQLWDAVTHQSVRSFVPERSSILQARLGDDGRLLAALTQDGAVQIWQVASGRVVADIAGGDPARSFALSADGRSIVTTGWSGRAALYEVEGGRLVGILGLPGGAAAGVTVSADGRRVVGLSRDGQIVSWPLLATLPEAIRHARGLAGPCLTADERAALAIATLIPAWCRTPAEAAATP